MRIYIVIPLVIAALAAVLYFSDQYDHAINSDKITMYQCQETMTIPALEDIFENNKTQEDGKLTPYFQKDKNYLGLRFTSIEELPDSIFFDFPCLNSLNLRGNNLKTIPSSLRHLPQLQELNLNGNQLSSLKTDIFSELYQLSTVKFSDNPIQKLTIPMIFSQIALFQCVQCELSSIDSIYPVSINRLDLSRNKFTTFPIELLNLNTLKKLDLSKNKINTIDLEKSFSPKLNYSNLSLLNLRLNGLTEFPTSLYKLTNLQHLYIQDNNLSGTLTLKGLLYLKALNIPNQNLEKVIISNVTTDRFGTETINNYFLPSMDSICLENNQIESFIVEAEQNNSIYRINLSQNKLDSFPSDLYKFKELGFLDLSHNQIKSILFNADFEKKCEFLDLSHNQIHEIDVKNFSHNSFRKVDLSHNRLTEIPGSFLWGVKTAELNLSNNNIKNMEVIYVSYGSLRILDLSNNPITSWNSEFPNLFSPRELNLSNTNISYIPFEDLAKIHNLKLIILKNTKIPNFLLQEMEEYLREHNIEVVY